MEVPTNLPKLDDLRFFRSKKFPPGSALASKAFTSFSFFRNSWIFNSTSCEGGEDFCRRCPSGYQLVDGRDGTGWCFFCLNDGEMMGRLQKCRLFQKSRAFFDECWGAFPALFLAEAPFVGNWCDFVPPGIFRNDEIKMRAACLYGGSED